MFNHGFWKNKKVFITGHTGFKGAWLSLWLHSLGAKVTGYALSPPTNPSLFQLAQLEELIDHHLGDVRDCERLTQVLCSAKPELVIHMSAQPLVRESYRTPKETFAINVMGTVHLLEAVRRCTEVRAVVNVTTDKCYENQEWHWGYRENEALGGHDPYSSSKACSELVTAAWRKSFLAMAGVGVATARAGNVIGGGDWASERLLPDLLRALDEGETVKIRSPQAIRPWQHVLEPLCGYLLLAERLYREGEKYSGAWNFGPMDNDARNVLWIVRWLADKNNDFNCVLEDSIQPHEAGFLKLDSSKSRTLLGWVPRYDLDTSLTKILEWHKAWRQGDNMRTVTQMQIESYQNSLKEL